MKDVYVLGDRLQGMGRPIAPADPPRRRELGSQRELWDPQAVPLSEVKQVLRKEHDKGKTAVLVIGATSAVVMGAMISAAIHSRISNL
jgi:hypothetical protein